MVKWALSFAFSCDVSRSVRFLSNTEQDSQHTCHKEEAEGRIKTDQADRQSLRDTLDVCTDLLEYASHPDGALMNIVTWQIAHPDVNADNAVSLGHRAMENVKGGWPDSLYCPPGKLFVTMDVKKNHVLVGKERVYDQKLIYARVIGLLVSSREINFNDVDTIIYYVSVRLWVITWPSGKLRVYVEAFKAFVHQSLRRAMSSSWLIGTSPTASIPSGGRRDQDQVASINWHSICRLQRSKSSSPTPKTRSNWMTCLQKAFSTQATSPKQHICRRTPWQLPVSAMCQLR